MLQGQIISVWSAIIISIIGIGVVMLELGFLAIFIKGMTSVMEKLDKEEKKEIKTSSPTQQGAPKVIQVSEDDDDLAVIMSVVLEESGLEPNEIIINSITRIK